MAYTEYSFSAYATSNYGTATKAFVEEIVSTVPQISIDTVNTDTASQYSADLSVSFCSDVKMRINNSSGASTVSVSVGTKLSGSSNSDYYATSKALNISGGFTLRVCISQSMIFLYLASCLMIGKLDSTPSGDPVEIYSSGGSNIRFSTGSGTHAICSIAIPTIGTVQGATLPGNTAFMAEGICYTGTATALKAPYTLNGKGPYSVASAAGFRAGTIISNGTLYFYLTADTLAWKL